MFQSAVVNECLFRNVIEAIRQAHCETQVDLGVWIQRCCTQLEDISQTLGGSMFALNAVVAVCGPRIGGQQRSEDSDDLNDVPTVQYKIE